MHSLQVTDKPKGRVVMLKLDGKLIRVFLPENVGTMLCRDEAGKLVWVERKSG